MKNIRTLFKIHPATYFLIFTFLITGLIKNIILIYIIIMFHELGHIFIIKILGYKIKRVDIYPMGGVTLIDKKINSNLNHELLISIFGILFQFLLIVIIYILLLNGIIHASTYTLFKTYNFTIMIFNMLPIIPLDGYQFLRAITEKFLSFKKAFYLSFIISIIFILLFITYNQIFSLNNYLMISFLIYKMFTTFKDFKFQNLRFELERFLEDFSYHKIKYENNCDLQKLKKDTYHFFKGKDTYISEKKLLEKKYKIF